MKRREVNMHVTSRLESRDAAAQGARAGILRRTLGGVAACHRSGLQLK